MKRLVTAVALLAAACSLTSFPVAAGPITYVVQTTASGSLDGVSFTNAPITVTLVGDTSGIVSLNPATQNFSLANPGTATLVISGVGGAVLTDPMYAVSTLNTPFDGGYGVGIIDPSVAMLVDGIDPSLQGYNLATPLNYSGGGGVGNGGGAQNTFPTSEGNLIFTRQQPPISVPTSVDAILTNSLTEEGGMTSAPVYLLSGGPIGEVSGTISGSGAEDYYSFYWNGGMFAATASVTNAVAGTSFVFSGGTVGSCNLTSQTLNAGDNFSGTISSDNLAPGLYCIGLTEDGVADPDYSITFDTPLTTPEPGTFVLFSCGVAAIAIARRVKGYISRS